MRDNLSSATVTFLFRDVEGLRRLLNELDWREEGHARSTFGSSARNWISAEKAIPRKQKRHAPTQPRALAIGPIFA
jgi:hypothetical protein